MGCRACYRKGDFHFWTGAAEGNTQGPVIDRSLGASPQLGLLGSLGYFEQTQKTQQTQQTQETERSETHKKLKKLNKGRRL